jgi:hypothetical protein
VNRFVDLSTMLSCDTAPVCCLAECIHRGEFAVIRPKEVATR